MDDTPVEKGEACFSIRVGLLVSQEPRRSVVYRGVAVDGNSCQLFPLEDSPNTVTPPPQPQPPTFPNLQSPGRAWGQVSKRESPPTYPDAGFF